MSKSALILRHLAFEDLGSFGPVLDEEGYRINHVEAGIDALPDSRDPDLVVVLGGPIGVNDADAYPCMKTERDWLAPRLAARRPTLGICLGAQLLLSKSYEFGEHTGLDLIPGEVKKIETQASTNFCVPHVITWMNKNKLWRKFRILLDNLFLYFFISYFSCHTMRPQHSCQMIYFLIICTYHASLYCGHMMSIVIRKI